MTLYLLALLALVVFQEKIQFQPSAYSEENCRVAKESGFSLKDIGLETHYFEKITNEAKAWYVVFHGSGGQACTRVYFTDPISNLPLNFILAEYPGYGPSKVKIEEGRIRKSALHLIDHLVEQEQLPVILFGESLGTGVATYVASQRDTLGMILQAPYSSVAEVAKYRYPIFPVQLLIRNPFMAKGWAPQVTAPILVIHGTRDKTIPIRFSKELYSRFVRVKSKSYLEIPEAGHNNLHRVAFKQYWQSVQQFLISLGI